MNELIGADYRWLDVCPAVALSTRLPVLMRLWLWCVTRLLIKLLLFGIRFWAAIREPEFEFARSRRPLLSPVDILEKANSVSGKLGGVAGVLAGVHIYVIDNYQQIYFIVITNNKSKPVFIYR